MRKKWGTHAIKKDTRHASFNFGNVGAIITVYSRPSVELVWGQHRRRFTDIEPAMGCDAGPTLNRNWMGRPTSCVRV